jgi:hypothetical protein
MFSEEKEEHEGSDKNSLREYFPLRFRRVTLCGTLSNLRGKQIHFKKPKEKGQPNGPPF